MLAILRKTYFLVESGLTVVVSVVVTVVSAGATTDESVVVVVVVVESAVASPPPLLQATKAPTARTNKSFFIVFIFGFMNELFEVNTQPDKK